ncbi:uncharacterized protein LOC142336191 isoform X2 [Convolutriloba macropyga]|uniref:uncharacterized protein LOC142336191 isoform X2 n=1 Tax=Convolutriloba macropyga TaxID=536237 RepID=UPI003F525C08
MSAVNTSGIPQVLATDAKSSGSDRNLAMFAAPASSSAREEFHRFLDKVDIVEMVFYWSILVVGVPCNLIVSVLLIMRKRLHAHAYQLLILAIALSDMCVLLSICLLDSLFYLHRWGREWPYWLHFHCRFLPVIEFTSTLASVWFVVLFSVERYLASVSPERGRRMFSRRRCSHYICATLALSLLFSLSQLLVRDFDTNINRCKLSAEWELIVYVFHVLLLNILPIGVIVFCNVCIVRKMYECKRRQSERRLQRPQQPTHHLQPNRLQVQGQTLIDCDHRNSTQNDTDGMGRNPYSGAMHRATIFLVGLSVCYTVLYLPKLITDLIAHMLTDETMNELRMSKSYTIVTRFSEFLYLSNSLVNFFVYSTISPSFRRHLAKLFFIHLQAWRDSLESVDTRATSLHNGLSIESLDNKEDFRDDLQQAPDTPRGAGGSVGYRRRRSKGGSLGGILGGSSKDDETSQGKDGINAKGDSRVPSVCFTPSATADSLNFIRESQTDQDINYTEDLIAMKL